MTYEEFLSKKLFLDTPTRFEPKGISKKLFPFQQDITTWACRRGRAALFEDCGLGKTPQQLEWARQVNQNTDKPVLILAPYCVAQQTRYQGEKFGIEVNLAHKDDEIVDGINITNYEKLHKFNASRFSGIVLDESSILKSYDGKTRDAIIDAFARTPFKLACTATPAPNDFMELGNHAEFLGVMTREEMLATFFVHDGGETSKWRLKRHAQKDFWRWICSWAVNIRKPSDLGYENEGFELPKLNMVEHVVESNQKMDGYLFALPASSLQERRDARRSSLSERVEAAVKLADKSKEQWVFWCNLNSESEAIADALKATEIRGSTTEDEREEISKEFLSGKLKRVVTKPSIWGFGMNLQCCANTALVGLSDSYEEFYQVIRRFWRFGQTKQVNAHIIISHLEGAVLSNIHRKESDSKKLADEMIANVSDISSVEIKGTKRNQETYTANQKIILPKFL
ncbi:MAG: helicase [Patescibacteria group bacterium]|nr:helicase [Patescibacteria group bacterium]